ncbi:PREDICTED: cytochrome P450 6k1-like [Rhagoletis zephyria]|uniref:cytochrome P450 6k1-like n=1 Tax=Rhagoletis zephyria TaxID=28612 RepID=UPI000811294C|nr:PREDICTED: cytochrome P450 6k1-like [Rhagoletis zephyria]
MSWPKTYGSIYGFYQFTKPILTINEPELAKEIIVKNFSSFINREKNSFDHEYFNSNLFSSNDEVWRRVRSITSPSFTSGKLKLMHGIMEQCVKKLERYLKKDIAANGGVINLKESITGFTIDVIAQTSFGAETSADDETEVQETAFANTSTKKTLQTNEIIAQCIIFFLAGFETTATTTSMVAYFLALNPHVQDRLHSELTSELDGLDPTSEEYFNKVTTKLPYLDAVIKETLRRNPPLPRLKRHCNVDDYKLGDTGIHIERDSEVHIGIYSIQHNPKYFPDPETFNPDRFMPENKHLLVPYSWLPFGAGPRNCIGMRFAYQEIKLCLATIVRKFRFERAPSTPVPIFFNTFELLTTPNIELKISVR